MSGDAANTNLWTGADVFLAPLGTTGPADLTTAWGASWALVGLLDGDQGIVESRAQTESEFYSWGSLLYRRTVTKQKRTFKFYMLEDNATTFELTNPGSTRTSATGVRTANVKVPLAGFYYSLGFELRDGSKVKRRIAAKVEVTTVADIKESESNPSVFEITVLAYPDSTGSLYTTIETDPDYVAP